MGVRCCQIAREGDEAAAAIGVMAISFLVPLRLPFFVVAAVDVDRRGECFSFRAMALSGLFRQK